MTARLTTAVSALAVAGMAMAVMASAREQGQFPVPVAAEVLHNNTLTNK